jgi:hypothetical protein
MIELFNTTFLKNMTMSNRFVRYATWSGKATENGKGPSKLTKATIMVIWAPWRRAFRK